MASNKQFFKQIGKFIDVAEDTGTEEIRGVALAIGLTGVVQKSPVDKGTFKGNWNVALGRVDTSIDETKTDKTGSQVISEGGAVIGRFKIGQMIYITNNMPYGNRLEYGWSAISQGMIRRTFQEMENFVERRSKKV